MQIELPKMPAHQYMVDGKELFTIDQVCDYGIEARVDALETLLKVIADQQKTIEKLSQPTTWGFPTNTGRSLSQSASTTGEDYSKLFKATVPSMDGVGIRKLATKTYEDYYHKIRAEVPHDLWVKIFEKAFQEACKIYEPRLAPV